MLTEPIVAVLGLMAELWPPTEIFETYEEDYENR